MAPKVMFERDLHVKKAFGCVGLEKSSTSIFEIKEGVGNGVGMFVSKCRSIKMLNKHLRCSVCQHVLQMRSKKVLKRRQNMVLKLLLTALMLVTNSYK